MADFYVPIDVFVPFGDALPEMDTKAFQPSVLDFTMPSPLLAASVSEAMWAAPEVT